MITGIRFIVFICFFSPVIYTYTITQRLRASFRQFCIFTHMKDIETVWVFSQFFIQFPSFVLNVFFCVLALTGLSILQLFRIFLADFSIFQLSFFCIIVFFLSFLLRTVAIYAIIRNVLTLPIILYVQMQSVILSVIIHDFLFVFPSFFSSLFCGYLNFVVGGVKRCIFDFVNSC